MLMAEEGKYRVELHGVELHYFDGARRVGVGIIGSTYHPQPVMERILRGYLRRRFGLAQR